ncbi:T9SS type A sorting domain-containing protein [uncultured Psychroserpens sp.]|uniref:T9SS type A sorting domain-containing protein n=1 Tax=uncultured Psychroserpens sp. TaxID=255436 RepID=UPI00260923C0|nr:T9SS type A sorting domain-containing protein [uncultured Psychroserpens sp.]
MKNITLLLFFTVGYLQAQIVDIPDVNFKDYLLNYTDIDTNEDNEIQFTEAATVQNLFLSGRAIADLTGIEAFTNLEKLFCQDNLLTSMDLSNNSNLEELYVFNNALTALDLGNNSSLTNLDCSFNQIESLDLSGNVALTTIRAMYNHLSDINLTNLTSLTDIEIYENQLTTLDLSTNTGLLNVFASENLMSSIDVSNLPLLNALGLSNNQLSSLDLSSNPLLYILRCDGNQMTDINVSINSNLWSFSCANNAFTTLDLSSLTTVQYISINDNPNLTYLNYKTGNNNYSDANNYGNFENLTSLEVMCVDDPDSDFAYFMAFEFDQEVLFTDYCSVTPGGDYNTITGTAFFDSDNNGCDVNDTAQFNIKITIDDGVNQGSTFTNADGTYVFYTNEGNFDVAPDFASAPWFNITPASTSISFADDNNNIEFQDFCLTTNSAYNDVEVVIVPIIPAQPGFDVVYDIVFKNNGNQIVSGGIDFSFNDAVLNYIFSSEMPVTQSTGILSWNYLNLQPFESRVIEVTLNVNSPMETPAVNIGDILQFNASISPLATDDLPSDNSFDLNQIVVGSYDPNDITCLEGDIVNPEHIGEYLHYNINFENTGTAAATFIAVKDSIDNTQLDINTLEVLYSSHDMTTTIEGQIVEFFFDNINLAPEGQGNIVFKIKSLETLVQGDFVDNKANIFFDYNFPIETNVANTVFDALSVNEFEDNTIHIYPNPSADLININTQSVIKYIDVYDLQGRRVRSLFPNLAQMTIDISNLTDGIYFIKVKTTKGEHLEKIVKQ